MKEKVKKVKEESTAYELQEYTYQDILEINDENRYEIIDGKLYIMESPKPKHQMYLGEIYRQFANYLFGKTCIAFMAPSDVKLNRSFTKELKNIYKKIKNYVQPDIYVICNRNIIDNTGILGVPDMVIEILSHTSKQHDLIKKFNLYQKYEVKEYVIVDPIDEKILIYILENKKYILQKECKITDNIKINTLENLTIDLKDFYNSNQELLNRI